MPQLFGLASLFVPRLVANLVDSDDVYVGLFAASPARRSAPQTAWCLRSASTGHSLATARMHSRRSSALMLAVSGFYCTIDPSSTKQWHAYVVSQALLFAQGVYEVCVCRSTRSSHRPMQVVSGTAESAGRFAMLARAPPLTVPLQRSGCGGSSHSHLASTHAPQYLNIGVTGAFLLAALAARPSA